jgi:hypothetical protein
MTKCSIKYDCASHNPLSPTKGGGGGDNCHSELLVTISGWPNTFLFWILSF